MIRINNLTISFDGKNIIDGIDLTVEEGSTVVVLGKNGSGKSVLLKAIAGLIDEFGGSIEIGGRDIRRFFKERELFGRSGDDFRLAYVFQKGGLFDSMNVFDNVAFGLYRIGVADDQLQERVNQSLARVGLRGSESKLPAELSGGMQKRVGLARAVCMEPSVILYDDPTAGLDPVLSDSIADLILEIRNSIRTTSVIVTQSLEVARKVADRIALLYEGRFVFNGTADEFFSGSEPHARQFIEGDIEGPIDIF